MTPLKVQIRDVFGRVLIYPICESSKTLAKVMKQKAFTKEQIEALEESGFPFEYIPRSLGKHEVEELCGE